MEIEPEAVSEEMQDFIDAQAERATGNDDGNYDQFIENYDYEPSPYDGTYSEE